MANNPIPVYVFTGFLESGKTKFIKEIIADPNFTENEVTALLLCEEGIEEYDEKWLAHYGTALVPVESEDRLTPNILKRIEQKYNPDRIIVEHILDHARMIGAVGCRADAPSALTSHSTRVRVKQKSALVEQQTTCRIVRPVHTVGIFEFRDVETEHDH